MKNHNSWVQIESSEFTHYKAPENIDPERHTPFVFEEAPDAKFVLQLPKSEAEEAIASGKQFTINTQFGNSGSIAGVLLHSAHLTMFRLLKYSYAYSAAGMENARILRDFYESCSSLSERKIQQKADEYFLPYNNYIQHISSMDDFAGTVSDGKFLVWIGSSGNDVAYGVLVKPKNSLFLVWIMSDASSGSGSAAIYANIANGLPDEMTLDTCRVDPIEFGQNKVYRYYKPFRISRTEGSGVGIKF